MEIKATWETEHKCQENGGHLASIHSEEENTFVGEDVVMWDNVWVGGRGGNGRWEWVDGSEWDWSMWVSGQPGSGDLCLCIIVIIRTAGTVKYM